MGYARHFFAVPRFYYICQPRTSPLSGLFICLPSIQQKRRFDTAANGGSDKHANANEKANEFSEIKIDSESINRSVEEELAKANRGEQTELGKTFMQFQRMKENERFLSSSFISWKTLAVFACFSLPFLLILFAVKKMKEDEIEKNRKKAIGKARLGGEWELVSMEGKLEGSKDLIGNWVLIYFGFTNCPDICPDEIEKMVDVVDIINREDHLISIVPIFISVDPERDTVERVRKYCSEFSPKLRGYTGSKEQIANVTKAFRVYHTEGPRNERTDDYIVDHTVIMYLIDPDGNFRDYYGQNRRAREIANVIRLKALEWEAGKRKQEWWKKFMISSSGKNSHKEVNKAAV